MFRLIRIPVFLKVYVLMVCCVLTVGVASSLITAQSKAASKRYFLSDENPVGRFIPSLKNIEPVELDADSKVERDAALTAASKALERITIIDFFVDVLLQLFLISIYAYFLAGLIARENKNEQKGRWRAA